MKTKSYFKKENDIVEVINGRYGEYARSKYGVNHNSKWWLENGYERVSLSKEQADEIYYAHREEMKEMERREFEQKMQERYKQVEICLASEPLEIVPNEGGNPYVSEVANVTGGMKEAYHGCGKGTAYVKDGKVVAFHYGYQSPENVPESDCVSIKVELSCYQICF